MGVSTNFMGPSAQGLDPDTGVVAIMKGEAEAKRVTMMDARPMNTAVLSIEGILAGWRDGNA